MYVGTSDGVLHVVGMRDGRQKWIYSTGRNGPVAPMVTMGRVWLAAADGSVHALNAFTGRRLWVYEPQGKAPALTEIHEFRGPALLRGRLIQREGRMLVAIRAANGKRLGSLALPRGHTTYPTAASGLLVMGVYRSLYALSPGLDRIVWEAKLGEEGAVTPVLAGERLVTGTRNGTVVAVDPSTGRVLWRHAGLPAPVTKVSGNADIVFAATSTGNLYALEAESGKSLWRFDTDGSLVSEPVVSSGSLLFGSNDGRLYSLNAQDGHFEWSYDTEDEFVSSLEVAEDIVYLAVSTYRSGELVTRLFSLDINRMLSGLRAFGGDARMTGRMAEQDNVTTVLVDSAVVGARRVASKGGIWGAFLWPHRYAAAAGNPNAVVRAPGMPLRTATASWADPLALSAGVLAITFGPGSLAVFLLLFVLSAAGFAVWPRAVPMLGETDATRAAASATGARWLRRVVRQTARSRWMMGVTYGAELAAAVALVGVRLVAGPADQPWVFVVSTATAWLVVLVVSAVCRIMLLRGVDEVRRGGRFTFRRSRPRAALFVRVLLLYVVCWLAAGIAFALVDLAGVLHATWLLPVAILLAATVAPVTVADTYLVTGGLSIPRSLLAAARVLIRAPRSVAVYFTVVFGVLVFPAFIGATAGGGWGLACALAVGPFASSVLAGMSAEMCT